MLLLHLMIEIISVHTKVQATPTTKLDKVKRTTETNFGYICCAVQMRPRTSFNSSIGKSTKLIV